MKLLRLLLLLHASPFTCHPSIGSLLAGIGTTPFRLGHRKHDNQFLEVIPGGAVALKVLLDFML